MPYQSTKADLVRSVFENSLRYLAVRQFEVKLRAETVSSFADEMAYQRVLDIGCGDGSISLPLLDFRKSVTLLDLSKNMLSIAQSKVRSEFTSNVEVRNEDFMTASFDPASFDLIICVGVLAHVDSPDEFISKVAMTLKPGGHLILEFSDAFHAVGRLSRFFGRLREFIRPARYAVNLFSAGDVFRLAQEHQLRLVSQFRYALPPLPGIELLSHEIRYSIVRSINGTCKDNRNAWWGNQYICDFVSNFPVS
jgi:ubiquinone/menaquinone biosynthesis C-methylase UbiE